jgi:hypothetical protein
VYVDLMQPSGITNPFAMIANGLFEALQERPTVKMNAVISKPERSVEKRLRSLCGLAKSNGIRPLVCVDHLDKYLDSAAEPLDSRLLTMLAEFASLVLATEKTLTDISPNLAASPFVHKADVLSLGLLQKEDAVQLLTASNVGRVTELSPEDIDNLIKLVGRHPYILIRAGQQAHALLLERPGKRIVANDIRARIEPSLRPLFEGFWREYGEQLREYQHQQAKQAKEAASDQEKKAHEYEESAARAVRQELQRAALIYEEATEAFKFHYFSPLFESFVFQKVAAAATAGEATPGKTMSLAEMVELLNIRHGTKEYELLELLIENAGTLISDPQLQSTVWGDEATERAMVTTISRLRQKLQQNERAINGRIVRIRNKGYSFEWLS